MENPLLSVRDLEKRFPVPRRGFGRPAETVRAVDGVTFDVRRREILSVVGESGSGKTTVGRTVLRLTEPSEGSITFDGADITHLTRRQLRPFRRRMQLVFQDPYSSLNPRKTVEAILTAPLKIHGLGRTAAERHDRVAEALKMVGLLPQHAARYPHEFSGGQRQRIGIARALICGPELLVADEPVSALDVSVQAQVVNTLLSLKAQLGLTILFISHDLSVVGLISGRIAVMYLGRVVELADTKSLFESPRHPYTEALLSAAPVPDPGSRRQRIVLTGDIPSPLNPPSGCSFRTRCRYALPECAENRPALTAVKPGHLKACIRDDLVLRPASEVR